MPYRICRICKEKFYVPSSYRNRGFYCSQKCYGVSKEGIPTWNKGLTKKDDTRIKAPKTAYKKGDTSGKRNWNWKGGIKKSSQGYVWIYKPEHPFANYQGYVPRARLKIEKHLGRYLKKEEIVHHLNNARDDDRLSNLLLFANSFQHKSFHAFLNNPKSTRYQAQH